VPLLSEADLRRASALARRSGVDPTIVVATGPTRVEALAETSVRGIHTATDTARAGT
jgi:hypothetical protein